MPKNYDEQTDFTSVTGDNNQNTEASIQPIAGGENLWEEPLNRAPENLRQRTEVLRKAVDDLRYYADYDRHFTLFAPADATFTFGPGSTGSPRSVLSVTSTLGGNVTILPTLTPGANSGGRALGAKMFVLQSGAYVDHAGLLGTDDLTVVASSLTTGMRGYADTDNFSSSGDYVSLGGNRLRLTLAPNPALAGGSTSISVTVSGTPATNFTIAYGTAAPATTLAQLISFINTDNDLGGTGASYGLSNVFYATTTVPAPALTAPPLLVDAIFQGGYDAEEHSVTVGAFATFFTNPNNWLEDGEALALAFTPGPVEDTTIGQGGRRQALRDLPSDRVGGDGPNTNSDLILFNTGREPEKIPGSIAIGKRIGDLFFFIDGTAVGTTPTSLGETPGTRARTDTLRTELASATDPTGASLVGFRGTQNWVDATGLSSTTVQTAINEVVSDLASQATGADGTGRIGAYKITGTSSDGNGNLDLETSALSAQIGNLLNAPGGGLTTPGGVNYRVSEYGHRMHGPNPIEKIFSETGPSGDLSGGGGQLIRAVLNPSAIDGTSSRFNREEQASIYLEPLTYPEDGGDGYDLTENEAFTVFSADSIDLTGMDAGRAEKLRKRISVSSSSIVLSFLARNHCVVKLSGLSFGNGFYFVRRFVSAGKIAYLVSMSGATPALTLSATGTVTFYRARIVGSSATGTRTRSMLLWAGKTGADAEYYGSGYIAKGYSEDAVLEHTATVTEAEWSLTDTTTINDGVGATVSSVVPGVSATIVGLSGMETESVGNYLDLTSGTPANNGLFLITTYVSPTSVVVNNTGAVVDFVGLKWDEIASAARRTPNILIDADARLLKGRENNATVDATLNHHHDSRYALLAGSTRTIFYDGPQTLSLTSPWGSDIASLAVAATTTVTTYATIPTGFTKTAAILRAEVAGHTDLTGAVGETVRLRIGMRRIGLDNENILALQHLKPTTTIPAIGSINFGTSGGGYATDGDTLFISDGTYTMTFEYDSGGGVPIGHTAVPFTTSYTPAQMASALTTVINSVGPLQITAEVNVLDATQVRLTNTRSNSGDTGNIPITLTATDPLFSGEVVIVGMGGGYSAREELYKSEQILVPVDSDRTFRMVILAKTSNLDTDVALTLTEIGAVITPTP